MRWLLVMMMALSLAACARSEHEPAATAGENPATDDTLPTFSLPAPTPSARMNLDRAVFGNPATIGDVERQLRGALKARGYPDGRYYAVPGGFALATEIERIRATGEPYPDPDRWKLAAPPLLEDFSFGGLLERLRHADPGRYRVLVFLVTTRAVTSGGAGGSFAQAQQWVSQGGDFLPARIAGQPLTPEHNIALLIYEFARDAVGAEPKQVNGRTAEDQLRATRLLR